MSNIDIVRDALARIKNVNGGVYIDSLFELINKDSMQAPIVSRDQIMRAMRDIVKSKFAVRVAAGTWRVKGRFVK